MRLPVLSVACVMFAASSACSGDPTISLFFPNEVSQQATQKISIQIFDRSSGSGAIGLNCAALLGQAGSENPTTPDPTESENFTYPLSGEERLSEIKKGKPIVYVLGHMSDDPPPILEGCSDDFDTGSGETEINLNVVVPSGSSIQKRLGDLQSGLPDQELSVPIRVQVQTPGGGDTPAIPGVELLFEPMGGFQIVDANEGSNARLLSNTEGIAEIRIRTPSAVSEGGLTVSSPSHPDLAPVRFTLGVVEPIALSPNSLGFSFGATPIALAAGTVSSGGTDLAVLSCSGEPSSCKPSADNTAPGETVFHLVEDIGNNPSFIPGPQGLGIVPTDVAILPSGNTNKIAISHGWRQDCRNRVCAAGERCGCFRRDINQPLACPCEGAEVVLLERTGGSFSVERKTLTGSSAVGLTTLRIEGEDSLAIAAAGRSRHERPCNPNDSCAVHHTPQCQMNPETCGCPPSEICRPGLPGGPFCVAIDKKLDLLKPLTATPDLINLRGCQIPDFDCDRTIRSEPVSTCDCNDTERGNLCNASDRCGCLIPQSSFIGTPSLTFEPLAIASGPFQFESSHGVVVGTPTSLEYMTFQPGTDVFEAVKPLSLNVPQEGVATTQFDGLIDRALDVVSFSRVACGMGNLESNCQLVQERPADEQGCLTTHLTAGSTTLVSNTPDIPDVCRRLPLDYRPVSICTGPINADLNDDIAISTAALPGDNRPGLVLYAGDGNGGLLLPPTYVGIDIGAAGPITCRDINGDGKAEVLMVEPENVHIFSAP